MKTKKENLKRTTGQRICALREARGLNQDALADFLGMSRSTLSKIECDARKLTIEELLSIAEFFDVSVDYLLCQTDMPKIYIDYKKNSYSIEDISFLITQKLIESYAKNIKECFFDDFDQSQQKSIATRVYNILMPKKQ